MSTQFIENVNETTESSFDQKQFTEWMNEKVIEDYDNVLSLHECYLSYCQHMREDVSVQPVSKRKFSQMIKSQLKKDPWIGKVRSFVHSKIYFKGIKVLVSQNK